MTSSLDESIWFRGLHTAAAGNETDFSHPPEFMKKEAERRAQQQIQSHPYQRPSPNISQELAYLRAIFESEVWPTTFEWCTVPIFALLLLIGLTGNFLVIFVVIRNESMRTVTNVFLLNLALADFMVLLFCLPTTVLWDITDTWWFGTRICKCLLFVQNMAVTVSVLTLVCISIERWYAICAPFRFKSSMPRTVRLLVLVWMIAVGLAVPESVTLRVEPFNFSSISNSSYVFVTSPVYFAKCTDSWGTKIQVLYQMTVSIALYFVPLTIIGIMYGMIAYRLWLKSCPPVEITYTSFGEYQSSQPNPLTAADSDETEASSKIKAGQCSPRHLSRLSTMTKLTAPATKKKNKVEVIPLNRDRGRSVRDREILTRHKAAKMLIAVVLMFFICWLPVHLLNICKSFNMMPSLSGEVRAFLNFICRFLTYFNSSANPILYNFMCERFQKEFRRAVSELPCQMLGKNRGSESENGGFIVTTGGTIIMDNNGSNNPRRFSSPSQYLNGGRLGSGGLMAGCGRYGSVHSSISRRIRYKGNNNNSQQQQYFGGGGRRHSQRFSFSPNIPPGVVRNGGSSRVYHHHRSVTVKERTSSTAAAAVNSNIDNNRPTLMISDGSAGRASSSFQQIKYAERSYSFLTQHHSQQQPEQRNCSSTYQNWQNDDENNTHYSFIRCEALLAPKENDPRSSTLSASKQQQQTSLRYWDEQAPLSLLNKHHPNRHPPNNDGKPPSVINNNTGTSPTTKQPSVVQGEAEDAAAQSTVIPPCLSPELNKKYFETAMKIMWKVHAPTLKSTNKHQMYPNKLSSFESSAGFYEPSTPCMI